MVIESFMMGSYVRAIYLMEGKSAKEKSIQRD
jgi:hypothetical protein